MFKNNHKGFSIGLGILAAGALGLMSLPTEAATYTTATNNLTVTANVPSSCSVTASSLAFGSYTGTQIQQSTPIYVTCTNGTPYNVGLDAGASSGATVSNRAMTLSGGTATLAYQLYSNSGYSVNWGNTPGTDTVSGTGTGIQQTLTVYGQINAGLNPLVGSYKDTVAITVYY